VTAVPLAEVAELNAPQVPAGAQLQVTPPFAESLATVAVTEAVSLTNMEVGVALRVTVITGTGVIVIAAVLALTVDLVTEVAVMTTVLAGTVAGAV
jgi:hypothetical protein